ncbi:MAG: hypothetical protein ACI4DV_07295 [Lachnospiraceae bacterium]
MRYEGEDRSFYDPEFSEDENPEEEPKLQLTKQERRWVALGALKSALLIGSVYIIAAAILIWLMLTLWSS